MSSSSSSTFTKGQTWGALKKAWKAYKIAKVQQNREGMITHAQRIRTLQSELGVSLTKFPELNLI